MRPRRFARAALVLVAGLPITVAAFAVPAHAAGTGGIEVTPLGPGDDGKQATAFHVRFPSDGTASERFLLRNVTDRRVSGRLYAASAVRDEAGSFAIGNAGSSPYVELADREVNLAPGARETLSFTIRAAPDPAGQQYAAIVVAVSRGSIVERAATLVYLGPPSSSPPVVPVALAVLAAGLATAVGGSAVVTARRRAGAVRPA